MLNCFIAMKMCTTKTVFTILLLITITNAVSEENSDEVVEELENGCTLIKLKSGKDQGMDVRFVDFFVPKTF